MRIFIAGAAGAVGRPLISQLVARGHDVVAISRSEERAAAVRALGAEAVVGDVFDRERVIDAVQRAAPVAVINQLTDLPASMDMRRLGDTYVRNNRVRREGTRNLLEGARRAGARRFIVQSMASWYRPDDGPEGDPIKSEEAPLWTDAPEPIGEAVRTVADMESVVLQDASIGVVLRYGAFYGPGTWYAPDGDIARRIRSRSFPIIGSGAGIMSFVHVNDAASAAVAALGAASAAIYNVVDDEPARASEWVPFYAEVLGAPPPRRVPAWLARLAIGRALTAWLTSMRGASNRKIAAELGWRPAFPAWRDGFGAMV